MWVTLLLRCIVYLFQHFYWSFVLSDKMLVFASSKPGSDTSCHNRNPSNTIVPHLFYSVNKSAVQNLKSADKLAWLGFIGWHMRKERWYRQGNHDDERLIYEDTTVAGALQTMNEERNDDGWSFANRDKRYGEEGSGQLGLGGNDGSEATTLSGSQGEEEDED
ncbi:uncharacterized protein E6C27_scaffold43G00480 [Cucumis melo var. makuwa]|uniref:Uncharacterized protein n=1 Tax=Cucumis melo var. makuwa TaxID=1194695 RepID=A0A5A7U3D7_CUCMM|nr:uncharacterized protein E6C27_scaffold43G00480 [Cucumis melo var. makuwa]